MNTLQSLLVIGLFGLFLVFAIAPVSNVASSLNDDAHLTGFAGFFFGNLTFVFFFAFIVVIFYMMWAG